MIGKKYSLGAVFEPTGEPLVKLANFDELSTQGQDIAGFIKTFKPESQYTYLHVIAMGAGEYWGCNVNGDWFSESDLIDRHKTFETHAKIFKEHDNKPYSPDYGKVAFAWYNPKMHRVELILAIDKEKGKDIISRVDNGDRIAVSMGCFPAGSKVLIDKNIFKNIEDILPGDKVLTHKGNYKTVNTKMLHNYSGIMCKIKVRGQTDPIICTGNHPILIRKYINSISQKEGTCPVCGKKFKFLGQHLTRTKKIKDIDNHKKFLENILYSNKKYEYIESWKEAKDIVPGDYVVTPFIKADKEDFKITKKDIAFSKIIGYFLSEGNYLKYYSNKKIKTKKIYGGLNFTFHTKETYLHADVIKSLSLISKKKIIVKNLVNNVTTISIFDKYLAEKLFKLVGEYSTKKYISQDIYKLSDTEKLYLLGSYIDGDGTYIEKTNRLSATSTSKSLIYGLEKLAGSIGIGTSIIEDIHNTSNGYSSAWRLMINIQDASNLKKYCFKAKKVKNTVSEYKIATPKVFISDNALVKEVDFIESYKVKDLPVYNISVEDDESYTVNDIAVHNCRVKFDVCSICHNKASKPTEYCDHIRLHKKEVYPDGKQVYMINPNPTFFD